jgi:hypothetical protein
MIQYAFQTCHRKKTNITTMATKARNGPLVLLIDVEFPLRRVNLIIYDAPSKQICFLWVISWSKSFKCSVNVAMMSLNLILSLEHFKGFRPANCRQKKHI